MYTKPKILLIEDDKINTCTITKLLNGNNYSVTSASTGKEGLSLAASLCPDMILLDPELSDMDGFRVLQQLRSWSNIPIIIISSRSDEPEKVNAFDLGADDYITKPFGTEELLARIRTSLRHTHTGAPNRIYQALDLEIDFDKRLVRLAGSQIHLTQMEYHLLKLLAENSGKVLPYRTIMNTLWGPYMDDNNKILRVNMFNIRRKIEKNPAQPEYLFTETGIGYRMIENRAR